MQVILLHNVPKIGHKFDVIDVADGFANNFLLPQKLAEQATKAKVADIERRRELAKAADDARVADLKEKLAALSESALTITAKADDNGHLYKKIGQGDIVSALKDERDLMLHKEDILLDQPLHEVGEHQVAIESAGIKAIVTVQIVAE